jgi:hypothetical protein
MLMLWNLNSGSLQACFDTKKGLPYDRLKNYTPNNKHTISEIFSHDNYSIVMNPKKHIHDIYRRTVVVKWMPRLLRVHGTPGSIPGERMAVLNGYFYSFRGILPNRLIRGQFT